MEKDIYSGISKLQAIYNDNKQLPSSAEGDGTKLEGRRSLLNRYALFSNRGNLIKPADIESGTNPNISIPKSALNSIAPNIGAQEQKLLRNPAASSIIEFFSSSDIPVDYDWGDFLYAKYYGKIPNTHMVTLRRYPGPIEDNIFSSEINAKPDIARAVTYMSEESGNNLKELLGMNFGLKYREEMSEVQTVNNTDFNNPIDNDFLNLFGSLSSGQGSSDISASGDKANAVNGGTDYDAWEVEGFYENRIFGPVDVIDKMKVRDRGLEFSHTITLNVDYSLRAYGNISPKDALLDVISNILAISYANAPFWGGAIRVREDLRYHKLMGNQESLKKGDFVGYFTSLIGDLGNKVQNIFAGGIGNAVDSALKNSAALGANKAIDKFGMRREYQKTKALLSGEATGDWHVTIGNPMKPIAVIGNLICTDTALEFDNNIGAEDFPTGIRATFTLEPARPRDITDIESMFNAGKGRMYLPTEDAKKVASAASASKSYYLSGGSDPNNENSPGGNENLDSLKSQLKGGTPLDSRFEGWETGQIANALIFHPVVDRFIATEKTD